MHRKNKQKASEIDWQLHISLNCLHFLSRHVLIDLYFYSLCMLIDTLKPEDDQMIVHCTIFGNPEPDIKWFKDKIPLNICSLPRYTIYNHPDDLHEHIIASLVILTPSFLDNGEYVIELTNEAGFERRVLQVQFQTEDEYNALYYEKYKQHKEMRKYHVYAPGETRWEDQLPYVKEIPVEVPEEPKKMKKIIKIVTQIDEEGNETEVEVEEEVEDIEEETPEEEEPEESETESEYDSDGERIEKPPKITEEAITEGVSDESGGVPPTDDGAPPADGVLPVDGAVPLEGEADGGIAPSEEAPPPVDETPVEVAQVEEPVAVIPEGKKVTISDVVQEVIIRQDEIIAPRSDGKEPTEEPEESEMAKRMREIREEKQKEKEANEPQRKPKFHINEYILKQKFYFVNKLHDLRVIQGKEFHLQSVVASLDLPVVEWRRNGRRLNSTLRTEVFFNPRTNVSTVTVSDARSQDSGTYTVTVISPVGGTITDQCEITVYVPSTEVVTDKVLRPTFTRIITGINFFRLLRIAKWDTKYGTYKISKR